MGAPAGTARLVLERRNCRPCAPSSAGPARTYAPTGP
jgi:hypothetical protein